MNTSEFPKELYVRGEARCLAEGDGYVNANSGDMAFEVARRWNSHEALVAALENLNSMARAFTVYRDDVGQVLQKQVEEALKLAKG